MCLSLSALWCHNLHSTKSPYLLQFGFMTVRIIGKSSFTVPLMNVPIQWLRFRYLIIRKLHSHFTLTMYGFYCMVTDLLTNKFRQVDGHSKIDSDLDQLKSNSGMTLRSNTELNQTKLLNSWHSTTKHSPTIISIELSTLFTEWPEIWYFPLLSVACY